MFLVRGKSVSGVVHRNFPNDGSAEQISLYNLFGTRVARTWSSPDNGSYSFTRIPPGTYYVTVDSTYGVFSKVYGGVSCSVPSCDPTTGTPVLVTLEDDTPNIDFVVPQKGKISGTIKDAETGKPLSSSEGAYIRIRRLPLLDDELGDPYGATAFLGADGTFSFTETFPHSGDRYALQVTAHNYDTQLFPNLVCFEPCNFAQTVPLQFSSGQTLIADFQLSLKKSGAGQNLFGTINILRKRKKTAQVKISVGSDQLKSQDPFVVNIYRTARKILKPGAKPSRVWTTNIAAGTSESVLLLDVPYDRKRPFLIISVDPTHLISERIENDNEEVKRISRNG